MSAEVDIVQVTRQRVASYATGIDRNVRPTGPYVTDRQQDDAVELAQQRTAMKVFSPSEQRDIINEGDGTVTAANLDSLDIEGTHYVALEAALSEDDDRVNPEDLWANW